MKIFLICPVRNATVKQLDELTRYINEQEAKGNIVFYPTRDNAFETTDDIGYEICQTNVKAISEADEVHIFFDPDSKGSLFDLGASFALGKKLVIVNEGDLTITKDKSFINMALYWSWNENSTY